MLWYRGTREVIAIPPVIIRDSEDLRQRYVETLAGYTPPDGYQYRYLLSIEYVLTTLDRSQPGEDGVWRYPLANVRLVGRQVLIELSDMAVREEQQRRGRGGG
ncbi:hypothetical protein U1Q18_046820 [Sarracenia purpurea var. burkii]